MAASRNSCKSGIKAEKEGGITAVQVEESDGNEDQIYGRMAGGEDESDVVGNRPRNKGYESKGDK